jgi:hypothetical protein
MIKVPVSFLKRDYELLNSVLSTTEPCTQETEKFAEATCHFFGGNIIIPEFDEKELNCDDESLLIDNCAEKLHD